VLFPAPPPFGIIPLPPDIDKLDIESLAVEISGLLTVE
jgi:hypothetical protein